MGCLEALAGCPLSHGCRRASVSAAASVGRWATSHRDIAAPKGEPSRCATKSLQKAKSRLPLWGRWTRVSEDGEGKLPAAPSHGLCGSAGGRPSQSRLPPCQLPQRGSQVSPPPLGEVPSLGGRRGLLQQPTPRTCASLLMSTSGASCHRREWRAQALGRESPGVQPPGSFCLVKGKSEVFFRDFSLFAGESGCFLQNPRAVL